MRSHQTIFWSIAALVVIQLARRVIALIKRAIRSNRLETVSDSLDYYVHHADSKDKQLLRTIIDAEVRQNGDSLYEKWRSLVLSPGLDPQDQLQQYQRFVYKSESTDRVRDVVRRTTDLESDKNSPLPFLAHRLEGYLLAIALFHFVERVETPEEYRAIFLQILDNNTFRYTPMYRSLLGASYLRVQKRDYMGKDVGAPAVMRYEFVRKRIGLLRLIEARFLNEIFLYGDVLIVTNVEPTKFERRIAKVLRVTVLGRKNLQAMTVPTW
jgi:hypothetical protein